MRKPSRMAGPSLSSMARVEESPHKGSCIECLRLPRELFEPGSTISHSFYNCDRAVERIRLSIRQGCHFCTLIFDALEAGQKGDSGIAIDKNGIVLKTTWTSSWPGHSPIRAADYSLLRPDEKHITTPTRESSPEKRLGPFLTLSWGNCVTQLRFNINSDAKFKKPSKYVTDWDLYSCTKNFEPAEKRHRDYTPVVTTSASPLAAQTDSPQVFRLLNSWLDTCQAKHSQRCGYVGGLVLDKGFSSPTRLLHIGEQGENVVLVNSADLKRDEGGFGPSYTALSHCWGDPKSVPQTTKANLAQTMSVGLSYDELSPTFQHAVKIARELNIGWLWIDSLCIVQDDKADTDRELPLMEIIYSMAMCTLVASDSKDGNGGCFLPRGLNPDMHLRPYTKTYDDVKTNFSVTFQPYVSDWAYQRPFVFPRLVFPRKAAVEKNHLLHQESSTLGMPNFYRIRSIP
ncbi:heterokaryon incompatibility protein-domain-containing protein [Colletotrichum godetiae]|uniref:Heterokaryon incompatibility protein-domain-containing protein n=1 Tax=Colletotrichum godetiae TaxID=1209918 RepID=A0AAJ0AAK7_9PEZI|nr:heterokaryon incompatibility protein-domain-containing protein [Colletotrichum godetiae]KAK1659600.1 heterokaryon incompatibility protein-domain-containing protein [Colletotrichum godetiae]